MQFRPSFAAPLLALAALAPLASVANGQAPAEATLYTRIEDGVVRAAIELEIEPGWHIYHGPTKADLGHPQAIGAPTVVELGGEGIAWSAVTFPEPYVEDQSDFGAGVFILAHEDYLVLYAAGRLAPGAAPPAEADIGAKLKGLVCQESCIPYNEEVTSAGPGPDALFADFPADLAPPAPHPQEEQAEPAAAAEEEDGPLPADVPTADDQPHPDPWRQLQLE